MPRNPHKTRSRELVHIISRNIFLFTNGIVFAVVMLLFVFGDTQAGIFLGIISVLNIVIALAQDIYAWKELKKLQLLATPRALRIKNDGTEELVLADEIRKGDRIKLSVGDQVPCDGLLGVAHNLEVNEGLITGESRSIPKSKGTDLLAGSIVTSGSGSILIKKLFYESRIARMTEDIKIYSPKSSPIQDSIAIVVKYAGFVLFGVLIFIISRGLMEHEAPIRLVMSIGALTSMLVPQGLVFTVTIFFAYGAVHFFRRHVLLQEVNATEKLGRIKNLCMDKTGTLTENALIVKTMAVPPGGSREKAEKLVSAYAQGMDASSESMRAIKEFLNHENTEEITETLAFSSWRRYGAVCTKNRVILAGPPDVFFGQISQEEKKWMQGIIDENAYQGKQILCFVQSTGPCDPHELSKIDLTMLAVFVFHNGLREGVGDTIKFFQDRGVSIRIISGDHPETVRAVAMQSGINNTGQVITGSEMKSWTQVDFEGKVGQYAIFAEIVPEQKEKIVEAFKKNGFTAMVGDGANDILAMKKADLGIAMFDGAPATRQIASIILTNNSFAALPGGVELADSIIGNIELFASIFLNLTFLGFFTFVATSFLGYSYPLTPLNVTFINYFTIGIPVTLIYYWTTRPAKKVPPASPGSFLKRVMPFAFSSALLQTLCVVIVFVLSPETSKMAESNFFVVLAFITMGFVFFTCAPGLYRGTITRLEKLQLLGLGIAEALLLFFVLRVDFIARFFDIEYSRPSLRDGLWIVILLCLFGIAQYMVAGLFKKINLNGEN